MVKIRVPATSANLGPGFDTLGLALSLFLEVKMDFCSDNTVIEFEGIGSEDFASQQNDNLVNRAAQFILNKAGLDNAFLKININNSIPVGKGLGSSASAIVAGMYAANHLIGQRYSQEQILKWAVAMEGHPDNIVPALVGGMTSALLTNEEVNYQKFELAQNLNIIVAVPDFTLPTNEARSVLPQFISLADCVASLQRACFLLASIANGSWDKISLAMDDNIFQNSRKYLIPGFDEVITSARQAGALGVVLSGAGPSILAIAASGEERIGQAMQAAFLRNNINSQILYLNPSNEGVILVDSG